MDGQEQKRYDKAIVHIDIEHGSGKKVSGVWTSITTVASGRRLEILVVGREFATATLAESTWVRLAASAKAQHGGSSVYRVTGESGQNNVIAVVGNAAAVRRELRMMQPKGRPIQLPDEHAEQLFRRWIRATVVEGKNGSFVERHGIYGGARVNDDGTMERQNKNV